jgi:hypothetical protein
MQLTPSGKTFIAAFRQAHDSRDIEVLSKLVCWDRVPSEMRKLSEDSFRAAFDDKIVDIRLTTEHPQGRPNVYVKNGITYRFNLPLVAEMIVENPPLSKEAFSGTYYPLGVKDGRYCIAQMAPVDGSDAQRLLTSPSLPEQAAQTSQIGNAAQPTVVPAKTLLTVRLAEDLGMKTAKTSGSFSATLVRDVVVNGLTVIPAGSPIQGIVAKKGNYSPDATLTSVTVNGTSYKISTGYMTFNEEVVFPAGSQAQFELLFPLKLMNH